VKSARKLPPEKTAPLTALAATTRAATRDSQMGFGWVNTTAPTTVTMTQSGLGSRMAIDSTGVRAGLPYSHMGRGLYTDMMSGIGYYPGGTPFHAGPHPMHVGPMSCGATHGAHTAGLGIPAMGQIGYPPTHPMGHYYVGSGPSSVPGSGSGTQGGMVPLLMQLSLNPNEMRRYSEYGRPPLRRECPVFSTAVVSQMGREPEQSGLPVSTADVESGGSRVWLHAGARVGAALSAGRVG